MIVHVSESNGLLFKWCQTHLLLCKIYYRRSRDNIPHSANIMKYCTRAKKNHLNNKQVSKKPMCLKLIKRIVISEF